MFKRAYRCISRKYFFVNLEDYGIFIEPYEWPDDDDEEPRVPWLTKGELWALEQKDKKDD